jgi:actin-related protein
MKVCTSPLQPVRKPVPIALAPANSDTDILDTTSETANGIKPETSPIVFTSDPSQMPSVMQPSEQDQQSIRDFTPASASRAPSPQPRAAPTAQLTDMELLKQSSHVPLDAAISASITCLATENKARNVASSILLVGGGSSLNGLGAFLTERYVCPL